MFDTFKGKQHRFAAVATILCLLALPNFCTAAATPGKFALLIGIDQYEGGDFKPLQGAKNDIALIKSVLTTRFHVPEKHVTLLQDGQATHAGIQQAFQHLADTINKGDFVYIHYSGHGSYACDQNGDEESAWGKDSTWVSHGARPASDDAQPAHSCEEARLAFSQAGSPGVRASSAPVAPEILNPHDILDDEINRWLAALSRKTDQIVFVSDSCHSGSVTRGDDALMTRGVPMDFRPHPLGAAPEEGAALGGIRLTACRDNEKASEYRENDRIYGMFTWFLATSMDEAGPDDTWGDLHRRTCARMRDNCGTQTPQMTCDKDRPVFGGEFQPRPAVIAVTNVMEQTATIQAGAILGVTKGSVYRKHGDTSDNPSTITITEVQGDSSKGTVSGKLLPGDLVVLKEYAPASDPIKIFVRAESEKDRELAGKVKKAINDLPAFDITDHQDACDFTAQIIRPRKDGAGAYIFNHPDDSLPGSSDQAPPECWVLTPSEGVYQDIKISLADPDRGIALIQENMVKLARIMNLTTLTAAPGKESPVQLLITVWDSLPPGSTQDSRTPTKEVEGKLWRQEKTIQSGDIADTELKVGRMLSFSVHNVSDQPYYVYLLDITSEGEILPFFPTPDQGREFGFLKPGEQKDIKAVTLMLEKPVREYIRLIAAMKPIDIDVLQQQGYRTRSSQGPLNPLEALLAEKAGHHRGRVGGAFRTEEWGTVQEVFEVKP